jgi:hypothetical protein
MSRQTICRLRKYCSIDSNQDTDKSEHLLRRQVRSFCQEVQEFQPGRTPQTQVYVAADSTIGSVYAAVTTIALQVLGLILR